MPVRLEGSCQCGAVTFSVESHTPQPYQLCYCSICRKIAGGGGYAINLGADYRTLKVKGETDIAAHHAVMGGTPNSGARFFCRKCASALWLYDPTWPELVHPFASAIDSDLPVPPSKVHLMLGSKANWVQPAIGSADQTFDEYPEQSIEDWHRTRGLWVD